MEMELDGEGRLVVRPLLTDLYQATMALGYWRAGRACEAAEFELFFRHCPFGGSFALTAGLQDCMRFLRAFRLRDAGSSAIGPGTPLTGREPPLPQERLSRALSMRPRPLRALALVWLSPPPDYMCSLSLQTCSSWHQCYPKTLTLHSSSTFDPLTALG